MNDTASEEDKKTSKKKRLSPIRLTLVILAILLGLLVLKVVLILISKPTISVDYVAEWNRISKPANYDPDENAAVDYHKALESLQTQPSIMTRYTSAKWPGDMDKSQITVFKKWLETNKETVRHIKQGADKPYFWIGTTGKNNNLWLYNSNFQTSYFREFIYSLTWQAKLEAMDGRISAAFEDIITAFKVSWQLSGNKTNFEQFRGLAFSSLVTREAFIILDKTTANVEQLKHFQRQLRNQMVLGRRELTFQHEKLRMLDVVQRMYTDNGRGNGHLAPSKFGKELVRWELSRPWQMRPQSSYQKLLDFFGLHENTIEPSNFAVYTKIVWKAMFGPDRKQLVRQIQEYFEYINKIKSLNFWQLYCRGIKLDQKGYKTTKALFLQRYLMSVYPLIELDHHCRAELSALISTIAILIYQAEKGSLPENLEQLVSAGYLQELPQDPYSYGPLVYRRMGNNFTLYSFGANFDDDGGTPSFWGQGGRGGDQVFWPVQWQNYR